MDRKAFEIYLHSKIPITKQMQISVLQWTSTNTEIQAPLAPNINHMSTAFGGSINTVCTVAGWSHVYFLMQEAQLLDVHIVIQKSDVQYLKPARDAFSARVEHPSPEAKASFLQTFNEKKKARLVLSVGCWSAGECIATFEGSFVIYQ